MRTSFEEHGYAVSAEEIKVRINNLTARFKKEKAIVGPSGGSPSEWQLYNRVNQILGSFRIHNVSAVVEDSIEEEHLDEEFLEEPCTQATFAASESADSPIASPSPPERPPPKMRKLMKPQAELMEEFKRTNARIEIELQHMREVDEKLLEIEQERNDILRGMAESSKELNEALVKFLNK
nr:uncharacterized protein LOC109401861 [Aedes albopictus]XP_029729801.1 uncharacterized protein LOC109401861 [Aedes albopictus]